MHVDMYLSVRLCIIFCRKAYQFLPPYPCSGLYPYGITWYYWLKHVWPLCRVRFCVVLTPLIPDHAVRQTRGNFNKRFYYLLLMTADVDYKWRSASANTQLHTQHAPEKKRFLLNVNIAGLLTWLGCCKDRQIDRWTDRQTDNCIFYFCQFVSSCYVFRRFVSDLRISLVLSLYRFTMR